MLKARQIILRVTIEWFANLTNVNTRRAYQQDLADFMARNGSRAVR